VIASGRSSLRCSSRSGTRALGCRRAEAGRELDRGEGQPDHLAARTLRQLSTASSSEAHWRPSSRTLESPAKSTIGPPAPCHTWAGSDQDRVCSPRLIGGPSFEASCAEAGASRQLTPAQGNKERTNRAAGDACLRAPNPGQSRHGFASQTGPPGSRRSNTARLRKAGGVLKEAASRATKAGRSPGLPARRQTVRRGVVSSAKQALDLSLVERRDKPHDFQPGSLA